MFGNKKRDQEIKYLKKDIAQLREAISFVSDNLNSVAKATNLQWIPGTKGYYAAKESK